MKITVFGLGEAGSSIAEDLAVAGVEVEGFDPADVATPNGIRRHDDPVSAVSGADLVLAITASADSERAMAQAWESIPDDAIYADMATSAPQRKQRLAGVAAERGSPFADAALMAPIAGNGLSTPTLASGTGAAGLAEALNPLGGNIEVIGPDAGVAAARKLMRSVVTKGLAGLVREAMTAAEATGDAAWAWQHLVDLVESADETSMRRLVDGTELHAKRRIAEMEAARDYLFGLGVPFDMTTGTIEHLRRVL